MIFFKFARFNSNKNSHKQNEHEALNRIKQSKILTRHSAIVFHCITDLCCLINLESFFVRWAAVNGPPCVSSSDPSNDKSAASGDGDCLGVTVDSGTVLAMSVSLRTLHWLLPYFFWFIRSPILPRMLVVLLLRNERDRWGLWGSDAGLAPNC